MFLPKGIASFTPSSKYFVIILFIIMPLLTFFLGLKFHDMSVQSSKNTQENISKPPPGSCSEIKPAILSTSCGEPPLSSMFLKQAWNGKLKTFGGGYEANTPSGPVNVFLPLDISFQYPAFFETVVLNPNNPDDGPEILDSSHERVIAHKQYQVNLFPQDVTPTTDTEKEMICDNKMLVTVREYDNSQTLLSLTDFIAEQNKFFPGSGEQEGFNLFKKYLRKTNVPTEDSYEFEGLINEGIDPIKQVYFADKFFHVYKLTLSKGGCEQGEKYSPDAEYIFHHILQSIKFQLG